MRKAASYFILVIAILALPSLAQGQILAPLGQLQRDTPREDGIGVAPARFELPMLAGTERTVVVNIIYNSASNGAQPVRLVASLGDWGILNNGSVEYYKPGTQPGSASPWMIFSPGEVTAIPGKVHPIRITISVPKDAPPGDHLAALFVESRPDNIKLDQNRRQVVLRFRMAALFYVMVPTLSKKAALENLTAGLDEKGAIIIPTLKNDGNSHLRPTHSVKIISRAGEVVAELRESESMPLLANSHLSCPIVIEKALPPGTYSVIYRINFKDGSPVVEGQTELIVKDNLSEKLQ